jgi:pimeloyl-ACP methyl ester carboxylesterase
MQKILLLHGALGSSKNFDLLVPLLQNNFEVHALTFEGHGGKTIPNHDFTMEGFANEVLEYLDQNKIDKISIFGYSMGGYVGLYLAKHFPERITKLYTLATKINWTVDGAIKEASMLNPIIIKEKVPKFALALEQLHRENWEALMQKTAQMMLQLGEKPTLKEEDFEQITIPVLISVGDNDVMVTMEETEKAFQKMPNAQLYIMPNTIHPIEKVDVEELANQIKRFVFS